MNTTRTARPLAALALSLTLIGGLAGCVADPVSPGMPGMPGMGQGGPSPAASATGADMADRMFVTMMIPHHEQAIEMSDLVLADPDIDSRVRDLAQRIKDAQGPEIALMQSWLEDWGMGEMSDMGDVPGMGDMPDMGDGMLSQEELEALSEASGPAAARLFLEQMIAHHEGAIEMAEQELANGTDADVLELARTIVTTQTEEIALMREILADR
jgi:uncharacterized protein (DUF305 family)